MSFSIKRRRAALLAVAAIGGVAGGAWAGLDAGAQVDGFYRTSPVTSWRAPISRPAPQPAAELAVEQPAPPPGSVWGQAVGRQERAFFDTDTPDLPREEEPPVRVHRSPPIADAPVEDDDGWVGPPPPDEPSTE